MDNLHSPQVLRQASDALSRQLALGEGEIDHPAKEDSLLKDEMILVARLIPRGRMRPDKYLYDYFEYSNNVNFSFLGRSIFSFTPVRRAMDHI